MSKKDRCFFHVQKSTFGHNRQINGLYKGYQYNADGTIRITDDMKGLRYSPPREYKPYAVIETFSKYRSGYKQIDRTFYNEKGEMCRQIHTGYHNNLRGYPFDDGGAHYHLCTVIEKGLKRSEGFELIEADLIENKDILSINHR